MKIPIHGWISWLHAHPWIALSGALSVLMVVAGGVAAYIALRRLPADYFVRPHHRARAPWIRVLRTFVGTLLIIAGAIMLVLPGQGVLSILLGLALIDVPAKHRAMHWILSRPRVGDGLNALRRQLRAPPFILPHEHHAVG